MKPGGGARSLHAWNLRPMAAAGLAMFVFVSTVVAVTPTSAVEAARWPKSRHDPANTAANPSETALAQVNVASLAQDWSVPVARHATPVISGGVVYVGCEPNSFCAVDAVTGAVRWKVRMGHSSAPPSAALVGQVLYMGVDSTEYALDAATGALRWSAVAAPDGYPFESLTAAADGLVFQSANNQLFAWDAATGSRRWAIPLEARATPAVAGGVLYVEANVAAPTLYAIRDTTGQILWSARQSGVAGRSPTVADGLVIVGASQLNFYDSGQLEAYRATGCNAAVCSPVWVYQNPRAPRFDDAVAAGIIYQGFTDGYVHAIDAATARVRWKYSTLGAIQSRPTVPGPLTVAGNVVYGDGGDGSIYAWSAQGCGTSVCQPLWRAQIGGGTNSSSDVEVLNGRVFAIDDEGTMHAFSPRVAAPSSNQPAGASPPQPTRQPAAAVVTTPTTLNAGAATATTTTVAPGTAPSPTTSAAHPIPPAAALGVRHAASRDRHRLYPVLFLAAGAAISAAAAVAALVTVVGPVWRRRRPSR